MQTNLIAPFPFFDPATTFLPPMSATTPRRTSRRRRRNAAVGGTTGATARALGASLWRQLHGPSSPSPATACCQHGGGWSCRAESIHQKRNQRQCPCRNGSNTMEKVTKRDRVHGASSSHVEVLYHPAATVSKLLEWELDRAHARIVELEEENKILGRFLRKLEKEKRHRRELEAANARLLRGLKQQSKSYSMERKARELMEEAFSELTREVEADQAEAELLRRRMREEMEEERRMLQMAEVWREERVQMKLSDAKLALEHKYSQLNRLQAEMEELLSSNRRRRHNATGRATRCLPRPPPRLVDDDDNKVDVDSVFEHFRRKEKEKMEMEQGSSSKSNSCASPATDLFLAKADGGTSVSASAELSHNNGGSKNTALIRRLWRSAITESRKKDGAEECTSSASAATAMQKQSLKEKVMEARMDDQREKTLQKHRD